MADVLFALALTTLAGLATGLGAAVGVLWRRPSDAALAVGLAFSSGVMVAVSFVELLPLAIADVGFVLALAAFLAGALALAALDLARPADRLVARWGARNPHLARAGFAAALGIALHNVPEGFTVLAGALRSGELGALLAVAVAIHNVPEGMSVSLPLVRDLGRGRAFLVGAGSGLFEPLGAVVALALLGPLLTAPVLALALAFVAGIMVYVTVEELLPAARRLADGPYVTLALVAGMGVMLASLALLRAA